jgi:hypothetical protein
MQRLNCLAALVAAGWLAIPVLVHAQARPYIGYVYPAGGQQGTTFQIKLGGQALDDVNQVLVTGSGITARVLEYNRALGAQEMTLLNEQLRELKRGKTEVASTAMMSSTPMMTSDTMMSSTPAQEKTDALPAVQGNQTLVARLTRRVAETVNRPASAALAGIAHVEVTIAPDAQPGERELRLGTPRGISNPLVFHVGQLPEASRKAMVTAPLQVLGKEEQALRKRPPAEVEEQVTLPCTLNGQIASGEINRYRFAAKKGQRLVIATLARQLIPFIADAVPGWFQPVLALYDPSGKEVAYDDDFRFNPDPTIFYEVPADGEYVLEVHDAIYRGREDFVYRITVGEMPFVTSMFPLGGKCGTTCQAETKGWNLGSATVCLPGSNTEPGVHRLCATVGKFVSNPLRFALDTLPEAFEREPNNTRSKAQKVKLPVILNGRMQSPGDWDVYLFAGKSNQTIVAEVYARRLDSPLDSVLKLTDARGKLMAFNDDHEDAGAGINTHHADSYLMAKLPADGTYCLHVGDAAQHAGDEYGYRLRISSPRPDFELRAVPSSISLRGKTTAPVSVYVIRKDGFTDPIKLALKDPPAGFSAAAASLTGTQTVARLTIRSSLVSTPEPVDLSIIGIARIEGKDVTREALPAEDRMQAFLWRHLVPASELKAMVWDPAWQPQPRRVPPPRPPLVEAKPEVVAAAGTNAPAKPKFTKQQVAGRLRQLKALYEENLLTDKFYDEKVTECETVQ